MSKITREQLGSVLTGVKLSKVISISPDNDSKLAGDSKQLDFNVDFDGVTLENVLRAAVSQAAIKYANTRGRKEYSKLAKSVTVNFAHAGKRDPIEASLDKFALMSAADKAAYIAKLNALAKEGKTE